MPQPVMPKTTKSVLTMTPKPISSEPMPFLQALARVQQGFAATRESWDKPACIVSMHNGQLCIKLDDKLWHPLIVSQEDFDGEDWIIVPIANVPVLPPEAKAVEAILTQKTEIDPRDQAGKDE